MKKVFLGLGALALAVALVPMFAAFEAHVINVTAQIENALQVSTNHIPFGTVFPQEKLNKPLIIRMSDSFASSTADDIRYVIKQKPKPINPADAEYCHNNEPGDPGNPQDPYYLKCYPSLCAYLSKDPDTDVPNDIGVAAFHDPSATSSIALGYLAKSATDIVDDWIIDLDVPCFNGSCAQDWTHQGYELDPRMEHATFGCDLWVEVTGVSRLQ